MFVPLVSHHQEIILGSIAYSLFICFPMIGTPSLVLSQLKRQFLLLLINRTASQAESKFLLSSFCFSSLGLVPRFYLSFFFVNLFSHHWDTILGSISIYFLFIWVLNIGYYPKLYLSFLFVTFDSHKWDTILVSVSVYSLFIWFLISGTLSQVLFQLNCFFLWFVIVGTPSQVLSTLNHMLFLFFLVIWDTIIGYISIYSLLIWFFIIGTPS